MRARTLIATVTAVALLAACRSDTVRIAFKPPNGARYRYDVRVRAVTRSTIADAAPRRSVDDFVLHAEHRVVRTGGDDTELEVKLTIPDVGDRTFTARFDRGAQLSQIQSIEGVPAAALGQLGLSEILPGPPARRRSGRWPPATVGYRLARAELGGGGSRLKGEGRLVSLGVVRGRDVATIESRYRLPVKRTTTSGDATIELDGTQSTVVQTVRALRDGAGESAKSVTKATYRVTLTPPAGSTGAPLNGRLTVEVRSTTSRLT